MSDEDTDPDDYAENELTLTNIASGQMLTGGICNDFFGDTEVGDLEIETFVSSATTSKGQAHHMFSRFLNLRIFFTKFYFVFVFLQGRSFLLKHKMPMYLFILTEKDTLQPSKK